MFRNNSPFGLDTNSYTGSLQSNGFSTMEETSSQISNLSRPSAKLIYLQRSQYAESINNMMDKFQYRVEHLFTCDLDGKELRDVRDCVERLKLLDQMGRVWAQNMQMEVRGVNLLLTDIETKEELESISLSEIQDLNAVLDAEVYNSLLTVSVQSRRKPTTTVFLFQCEDVRADYVQRDLSRALMRRKEGSGPSNAKVAGRLERAKVAKEERPASDSLPPSTVASDFGEEDFPETDLDLPLDEEEEDEAAPQIMQLPAVVSPRQPSPPLFFPPPYTELDRDVDILNHISNDIEIFTGKVAAILAKNAKKKKKKKRGKAVDDLPHPEEFAACLHKIKYGFNLVAELNGKIHTPSAPELVHFLFSSLEFVVSHCPEDLPMTIVAPLLTPQCIRFLSEEATTEEDQLWQSLGDPWNIPSTKWPEDDEDIPIYTLEFYDGWQPPEVTATPAPREPTSRRDSPQPSPSLQPSHHFTSSTQKASSNGQTSAKWRPPPSPLRSASSKPHNMRVKTDFISRNHRELTVRKGEIVELLDMSKQWWKVRNSKGQEGYVPNNVLEANDEQSEETEVSPVLTRRSKPAEVKAWLEDKEFSQITVRCLGVLSGSMLLGMTREELKTVCPEEGGRVFFQLQAVKSALAT